MKLSISIVKYGYSAKFWRGLACQVEKVALLTKVKLHICVISNFIDASPVIYDGVSGLDGIQVTFYFQTMLTRGQLVAERKMHEWGKKESSAEASEKSHDIVRCHT